MRHAHVILSGAKDRVSEACERVILTGWLPQTLRSTQDDMGEMGSQGQRMHFIRYIFEVR